jgi:hypothetical protein
MQDWEDHCLRWSEGNEGVRWEMGSMGGGKSECACMFSIWIPWGVTGIEQQERWQQWRGSL